MFNQMKYKVPAFLACILFVMVTMVGCSTDSDSSSTDSDSSEEYTIRISTVTDEKTPDGMAYTEFKDEVEEKSDGRINVDFFPNGQLYDSEREAIEATQLNNIEMTTVSSASLAGFIPEFSVLSLPYLFDTKEKATEILNGELGDQLIDMLPDNELIGLGYSENSFRHFFNNQKTVEKPDDISGMKVRIIENKLNEDIFNSFGANASPLNFGETYTALQQGVYDGLDSEITTAHTTKLDEVTDYLTLTGHTFTTLVTFVNKDFYESLPGDLQDILKESASNYGERQKEINIEREEEDLKELNEKMEVTELTKEQKQKFVEKTKGLYDQYEDTLGEDIMELAKKARE